MIEKLLASAAIEVGKTILKALANGTADAEVARLAAEAAEREVGQALARHRFDQKLVASGKAPAT